MAYIPLNLNPKNMRVGDCTVRAISKALSQEWETTYIGLCCQGLRLYDMPSANYVWGMYLREHGFEQYAIPSICPQCTTVEKFSNMNPHGVFILACQNHVVVVIDGDYYDTWDSGEEVVLYYWQKEA